MQPAAATDVSTQTTDQAEFGNVTAEVTKETLFTGKVSKVKVTYTAPAGETVDITVADETKTVTADGTESEVTLRVGAFFFFGESYPVDVTASIQGGESVDGTINADDGVVTLKRVDTEPEPDPANFAVSNVGSNSPVTEGETLDVTATVQNTGDQQGTQTVTLDVAGAERDSQSVQLAAGASQTVTLSWTTQSGDAGDYTATVASANDTGTTSVTVNEPATPANFQVSNLQAPSDATVGDTITVSADVENTGDQQGTQTVAFGVDTDDDGTLETLASQDETLASGASTTVTFDVNTSALSAGTYTHGVSTANDTATAQITLTAPPVEQPPNFQVQTLDTNSPVTEGETLTVDATVANTGDQQGTQTVTLSVLGTSDDQQVTLAGGASTTVTLSVATETGDAGQYSASVTTENDTASTSVQVNAPDAPANFQVSGTDSNSPVTEGETLDVTATVQNTGEQQGTQTVTLDVAGAQRDSQTVQLAAGTSQDVTLSWTTQSGDAGDYTATVASANDTGTTSVTVNEPATPANFAVSNVGSNSPVTEGETLDVTATVQNTGDLEGTQTVTLDVAGAERDSQDVTLAGGASTTVTLSWTTQSGDAGDYTATVASANNTGTTSVSVNEPATPANFAVSNVGSNSPVNETETLDVTATVQNTGDLEGTQTVTLDVAGAQRDSQDVTLAGGASTTVTLSWTTQSGDAGDYTATVASANDTGATSVSVNTEPEPPTEPIPFTSYVRGDESYLHTGTPDNDRPITYPSCRDGQPQPAEQQPFYLPTPGCITVDGTLFPSNNTWEGDIQFPPARDSVNGTSLGTIYFEADLSQVGEAGGTLNRDTGKITLNTTVDIGVTIWNVDNAQTGWENRGDPVSDPTCTIPSVSISLSTEKSFQTGSPFPSTSTVSGERLDANNVGKIVSDDFDVGSASGCGTVLGIVSLNDQINGEQGIPAGPGDNEVAYDVEFDFGS
ncbi:CARDB domain-containing protein [Halorientalis pallida]|uniref:CARDB domain-containing protein n=1 Tax=Halorientalis pallida TaxID=2479928 RepID=UPI003C6FBA8F